MKNTDSSLWVVPSHRLELGIHQVDIWRARLELSLQDLNRLHQTLSEEEKERALRFYFPEDRDRYITAHGCLRDVLGRYLGCAPRELTFSANPYGKPALNDHRLEFNLSHSGDFIVLAVTRERRVGIDVERIRSETSSSAIARRYFSKAEVADLESLTLEQGETAFFTCWTRKEAYIKAQGMGLSLPLESFDVSLLPDEPAILRATRPETGEASRWTLFDLRVDPGYAAAAAVEGTDLELRRWDWNRAYSVTAS
jgi:4'-phosphopantetheinyl transferase